MFSCIHHSWNSMLSMCPVCQQALTTTWSSGGTTPSMETVKDTRIKALEKEVERLKKIHANLAGELHCAESELSAAMQSVCTSIERVREAMKESGE